VAIVRSIVADGTTVILTTQYLDEADQLSDRIAVIDHGRVIAEGRSAELKAMVGANALQVRLVDPEQRDDAERLLAFATGAFDRFRSMPIWRPAPIIGGLIGDTGRYGIASTLVIGLGLLMGYRPDGGVAGVVAAVALVLIFAFGMGWLWTTIGLVMRSPRAITSVGLTVLFPLTFVSNIFVEPDTMPSWLRTLVDTKPISHLVTAERGLMNGTATAGDVVWVLAASAALAAVFAPLTMHLYRNKG
jgi:ABC-type multidrug transport system permease subunit